MSKPDSLEFTLHRAPSRGEAWVCVNGIREGERHVVADVFYSTKESGILGKDGKPGYAASVGFMGGGSKLFFVCLGPEFFQSWKRVGSVDDVAA